jgi:uncharacterized coiled-coil DUF342 family protein
VAESTAAKEASLLQQNEHKSLKAATKISSLSEVDAKIAALEHRQTTTSLSLQEEKRVLQEIKTLQQQRKAFAALGEMKESMDRDKTTKEVLDRKYKEKMKEIDAVSAELDAHRKVLDKLKEDDDANGGRLPDLRKRLQELKDAMQEKHESIKTSNEEFKKKASELCSHNRTGGGCYSPHC